MANPLASGQDKSRAWSRFFDQHGRQWGATTENKTRRPAGPLEPQFKAPFLIPNQFVRVDPQDTSQVYINYDQYRRDIIEARATYDQTLRIWAGKLYGQGAVAQAIADPQPELLDMAGPPPLVPPVELVEACMAGNRWILGFTDAMPKWAEEPYRQYQQMRADMRKRAVLYVPEVDLSKYVDADDEEIYDLPEGVAVEMVSPGRWGVKEVATGVVNTFPDGDYFQGNRTQAEEELALQLALAPSG